MTVMGPPHRGQSQSGLAGGTRDVSASVCGGATGPSSWKLEAKWQKSDSVAIGQKAEVTDADEAFGEYVQQEATQEFVER